MSKVFSSALPPNHSIFVGGKDDASSLEFLRSNKITNIVNCTPPRSKDVAAGIQNYFENGSGGSKAGEFKYLRIPVLDKSTSDLLQYVGRASEAVRTMSASL